MKKSIYYFFLFFLFPKDLNAMHRMAISSLLNSDGEKKVENVLSKKRSKCEFENNQFVIEPPHKSLKNTGKESVKECCPECSRTIKSSALKAHLIQVHHYTIFCRYGCKIDFSSLRELRQHILMTHNPYDIFICDKCYKQYETISGLNQHCRMRHNKSDIIQTDDIINANKMLQKALK